jgi:hypothetical protein
MMTTEPMIVSGGGSWTISSGFLLLMKSFFNVNVEVRSNLGGGLGALFHTLIKRLVAYSKLRIVIVRSVL